MASTYDSASVVADCGCTNEHCNPSDDDLASQESLRSARLDLMLHSSEPSVVALQAKQSVTTLLDGLPIPRTGGAEQEPAKKTDATNTATRL
ncbi:hypothetical protein ISF_00724 [Cordyceps fumosorosea ARSEF 2679]|uniref:Uncharacterized protein n=1 Tax=Cordyceps fumosorosea (strain ARSEF 2679) TaxID=1081104 RepID=A0A168EHV2_CORFA|nr:hypothetical protein ISF_00724 [Cordyceps fumosorosea ARSEF 2679]OAA73823.1 hypothetical protein ISF_00724 [Cordyceps fumosorosea ARSEF 2679]